MSELDTLDRLCNSQSHRAEYGLLAFGPDDFYHPFVRWVAELGRREGEFLRSKWLGRELFHT